MNKFQDLNYNELNNYSFQSPTEPNIYLEKDVIYSDEEEEVFPSALEQNNINFFKVEFRKKLNFINFIDDNTSSINIPHNKTPL